MNTNSKPARTLTSGNVIAISRLIGRGGEIRTHDPLRPRESMCFQRLHLLYLISNIYNNLGNLLFAQKVTQVDSTDRVLAQF
jgi:hypothetical protein